MISNVYELYAMLAIIFPFFVLQGICALCELLSIMRLIQISYVMIGLYSAAHDFATLYFMFDIGWMAR